MAALGEELAEEDVQKMVQVADERAEGITDFPGEYPLQHCHYHSQSANLKKRLIKKV